MADLTPQTSQNKHSCREIVDAYTAYMTKKMQRTIEYSDPNYALPREQQLPMQQLQAQAQIAQIGAALSVPIGDDIISPQRIEACRLEIANSINAERRASQEQQSALARSR